AHRAVPAGHHDLAHGERERPVDVLALRHVRRDAGLPGDGGWVTVDLDAAAVEPDRAGDGLEQRRLARPVHADEPADAAGRQLQARPVEGSDVAVADGDVVHPQGRRAHPVPPVSPRTMVAASWRMRSRYVGTGPSFVDSESTYSVPPYAAPVASTTWRIGLSETVDSQKTAGTSLVRTNAIVAAICFGVACCSEFTAQMYCSSKPASL